MARPARSDTERFREGMRSAALMHTLARRVGAENPHQFADYFDRQTGMTTQASGKWRLNFAGMKPLSLQQVQLLSRLEPDVRRLCEAGPADLWLALWGEEHDLWSLCRTRFTPVGPTLDDRTWTIVVREFDSERTFDEALAEFEGEFLLAEAYGEPLSLRHLTEAVALYRLHEAASALMPLGIDGDGLCRCIRLCVEDDAVKTELQQLGVFDGVHRELASLMAAPAARTSTLQRWDALAARLDWIA